jgi:MOSC domain-containing protein YiiM
MNGTLLSIFISPAAGQPMQSTPAAHALPGQGLEGDRYCTGSGSYSDIPGTGRQITLIEIEAIEALAAEDGPRLSPGDARRNLVTKNVALNHLVGKEFTVGGVRLRGMRLCEPCGYLAGLTHPGVLPGLVHRGGLRAEILSEGMIREGDPVVYEGDNS